MSKLKTIWLEDSAVTGEKFRLENNEALRAKNFAGGDQDLLKLDPSDELVFSLQPQYSVAPAVDNDLANKKYVDDQLGLLGSSIVYIGVYNANTNTPTLVDGTGTIGDLYRVNVAGSQDFGAGSITFAIGDKVVYNTAGEWEKWDDTDEVLSVNGSTGAVVLDTDDISEGAANFYYTSGRFDTSFSGKDTDNLSEGSSNLYFTDARAKAAAVLNSTAGSQTDQAPSVAAMKSYVAANSSDVSFGSEQKTLIAGDITNTYIDLAQEALSGSLHVFPDGGLPQIEGVDYTLSVVSLKTRVQFAGDLLASLVAGDVLDLKYSY